MTDLICRYYEATAGTTRSCSNNALMPQHSVYPSKPSECICIRHTHPTPRLDTACAAFTYFIAPSSGAHTAPTCTRAQVRTQTARDGGKGAQRLHVMSPNPAWRCLALPGIEARSHACMHTSSYVCDTHDICNPYRYYTIFPQIIVRLLTYHWPHIILMRIACGSSMRTCTPPAVRRIVCPFALTAICRRMQMRRTRHRLNNTSMTPMLS